MPRALADALFQRLIDSFPPDRAYAPAALEREPMPVPVAHFLLCLLLRRLRYEARQLAWPRSPWFDHDHPGVQRAQQAFAEALVEQGHFPPEAWEPSLRQAVEQVTAYLTRPTAMLVSFVFQDGEASVTATAAERRLGYLTGYGYLHEAVRLYFEQKDLPEIDRSHFGRLLRHIDQKITKDYDAEAWLRLLAPLFAMARQAWPDAGAPVPLALLQAFFEDKGADVVVDRLLAAREAGVQALDEAGLRRLLEAPEAMPEALDLAPALDEEALPPLAGPLPNDAQAQGPVPLWKQFQQGAARAPAAQQRAAPAARPADEPRRPQAAPARQAVPLWMQFRSEAAPGMPETSPAPPPTPAPRAPVPQPRGLAALEHTVLGTTGVRNRELFVKHLFDGAIDEYERVLAQLEPAPTWSEASQIIAEEIFRKNQVNIYSDPAVLFTDAVEARYAQP